MFHRFYIKPEREQVFVMLVFDLTTFPDALFEPAALAALKPEATQKTLI